MRNKVSEAGSPEEPLESFSGRRLLYIDTPYLAGHGGDRNRSRFLAGVLSGSYKADVVLVGDPNEVTASEYAAFGNVTVLPRRAARAWESPAIHRFAPEVVERFRTLLRRHRYDVVVCRFASMAALAREAARTLPFARIVIDADMLLSRIASQAWKANRSVRNRYYLAESLRLGVIERRLFREPFLFLFTNPEERDAARAMAPGSRATFEVLPNAMPEPRAAEAVTKAARGAIEPYVLFFGALDSAANTDAFRWLKDEIAPRLAPALKAAGARIVVAGRGRSRLHQDGIDTETIEVAGEVADMNAMIAGASVVLLPLRIASGTRTRILEAAATGTPVVTTSLGAEGLGLEGPGLLLSETASGLANAVRIYLEDGLAAAASGHALQGRALSVYRFEAVAERFESLIDARADRRLRAAIVTNRFLPEVGGAETNIAFQAEYLARRADVTVLTPLRSDAPRDERRDGYRIRRFANWLNPFARYPYLPAKTLSPGIFWSVLFGGYHVVQFFPALNHNNLLAWAAAKLSGAKTVFCSFDFLDYAGIIDRDGGIDPDLLSGMTPRPRERFVLEHLDHVFAISGKEIAFLRRVTPRVEYSPVPILLDEYEVPVPNPRASAGIAPGEFVFLSLGRVSRIKGQDLALDAFCRVAERLPGSRLVFVGRDDYEPEFAAGLRETVRRHGLEDRVHFTGVVPRPEVIGWLRHSDIHVIPVRFMNSGAVVVETWISGRPVLQSDVVDPNLVEDGVNGFLFRCEDVDDLASGMVRAYEARERLSEMAAVGERLVRERYTYEYLTGLYWRAWKRLLCAPPSSMPPLGLLAAPGSTERSSRMPIPSPAGRAA